MSTCPLAGSKRGWISGARRSDTLFGSEGNDTLDGGSGNDRLSGADGNDEIIAGPGVDSVTGGKGDDIIRAAYSACHPPFQNPLTLGGQALDVAMEMEIYAIAVIASLAGALASFFHRRSRERDTTHAA